MNKPLAIFVFILLAFGVAAGTRTYEDSYDHTNTDGTDHDYIDQDVTQTGSPTFADITLGSGSIDATEIEDGSIELVDMNNLNVFADEDIVTYETANGGGFEGMTISEILNPTGDSYWLVGTGPGTWQWETADTARTSMGLGTGDSPTWTGATITGCAVLGLNSTVFQPTTDSATFFQVLDADGGTPVLNVDSTNEQVTIGKTSAAYPLLINSTDGSEHIQIYHNNYDAHLRWSDGGLFPMTAEPNTDTNIYVKGNGTGKSVLRLYDQDDAEYIQFDASNGVGGFRMYGTNPRWMDFQYSADCPIKFFGGATSGETPELRIYGYRTGDAARSIQIGVGVDAANTASFDGVSEYRFDGTVRANTAFNVNGSAGVSGTLELDDGSTEKITLVFTGGILTSRTVEATTSSVLADWTD